MKNFENGKWYSIKEYYENQDDLDWALVQFRYKNDGFYPLPVVAEYSKANKTWHTHTDKDQFLNEQYEAVAFMLWEPIFEWLYPKVEFFTIEDIPELKERVRKLNALEVEIASQKRHLEERLDKLQDYAVFQKYVKENIAKKKEDQENEENINIKQ